MSKLTVEDVFDGANCGDHPLDIDRSRLDGAETLEAKGRCYCASPGWNDKYDTCGSYCDTASFAIGKLSDGRFIAVEEASDTSGHGCQCSGSANIYETYEEAVRLGLSEDSRAALKA